LATVYIPTLLQALTGGRSAVEVEGGTVSAVIDSLDRLWPGIRDRIVEQGRLRPNISVAVDGEITPMGLLETVAPESEVHFVAAIKGGRNPRRV
jgi:molybdopterin synthase sulfur carrier subunit